MRLVETSIAIALESDLGQEYLNNELMPRAPVQDGQVLCDLHTHPSNGKSENDLIAMLTSPGLIGLSQRYQSTTILTYEEARDLVGDHPHFRELTPGMLARVDKGYFARTQEVTAGIHHLLAIGCTGDYLPDFEHAPEAIQEIRSRNGLVILNHPYVVQGGLGFRIASRTDERGIKRLCESVDEIETHNGYCIDFVPVIASMKKANIRAEQLLEHFPQYKGIAASDCHRELGQVKICGVYIPEEEVQTMEELKISICNGSFERYGSSTLGPYVSRRSWLEGMMQEVDNDGYYEQRLGKTV